MEEWFEGKELVRSVKEHGRGGKKERRGERPKKARETTGVVC